jgi:chemotaxis protein MotB
MPVRPEFEAVLKKFAAIFTGVGQGLDLRIEGHTDGQAIRNVGTRTAHPTNWHLAAHRAIEVLRVLYQAGIDEDRITVIGYGSQRPIADNRTAEGRSRNRRVEIFVVGRAAPRADRVAETGSMGGE